MTINCYGEKQCFGFKMPLTQTECRQEDRLHIVIMGNVLEKADRRDVPAGYWVPILGSSIKILETLSDAQSELTLHQISTLAKVGKTSAFRILYTLQRAGYVERDPSAGNYRLGLKVLELARGLRSQATLAAVARPYLLDLRDAFGETANLAILNEDKIVYAEIVESRNIFRMTAAIGSWVPWHSTALGKSIAAFLPRSKVKALLKHHSFERFTPYTITSRRGFMQALRKARETGYSLDEEETELGALCIGVPILNGDGIAIGAISVSGPRARIRRQRKAVVVALWKVSAAILKSLALAQ